MSTTILKKFFRISVHRMQRGDEPMLRRQLTNAMLQHALEHLLLCGLLQPEEYAAALSNLRTEMQDGSD